MDLNDPRAHRVEIDEHRVEIDGHRVEIDEELRRLPILVVDDEPYLAALVQQILEAAGYETVEAITDPSTVPGRFNERPPALIVLDLHMPQMSGFDVMEALAAQTARGATVPFLVLTADPSEETKRRALTVGARDFLTKPFDQTELLLRVRNLLHTHHLQAQLRARNVNLAEQVAQRTCELERAQLETLDRLALAAEYRDDATQQHAWRIGRGSALLAHALGLPDHEAELLERASPLHDLGKIAIPDRILLKPGRLTEREFEQVKTHTTIGAQILAGSRSPLLRLAETISLTHHERWDGSGYPAGLSHDQIPLPGRIVAIVDTFDALTHKRPYKDAWPVKSAIEHIHEQSGSQFDPRATRAFAQLDPNTLTTPANPPAPKRHPADPCTAGPKALGEARSCEGRPKGGDTSAAGDSGTGRRAVIAPGQPGREGICGT